MKIAIECTLLPLAEGHYEGEAARMAIYLLKAFPAGLVAYKWLVAKAVCSGWPNFGAVAAPLRHLHNFEFVLCDEPLWGRASGLRRHQRNAVVPTVFI
jgi:hypothetical protein